MARLHKLTGKKIASTFDPGTTLMEAVYIYLLENYFLHGDLERQIEGFVEHCNHERYHESLKNVTPADVYFGRAQSTINKRERIKQRGEQSLS